MLYCQFMNVEGTMDFQNHQWIHLILVKRPRSHQSIDARTSDWKFDEVQCISIILKCLTTEEAHRENRNLLLKKLDGHPWMTIAHEWPLILPKVVKHRPHVSGNDVLQSLYHVCSFSVPKIHNWSLIMEKW